MSETEMTDAEVDELLERFDQTEPKLQRRIIAQFVCDRMRLTEENGRLTRSAAAVPGLLASCRDYIAHLERLATLLATPAYRDDAAKLERVRAAIAKATNP